MTHLVRIVPIQHVSVARCEAAMPPRARARLLLTPRSSRGTNDECFCDL